MSALTEAHDHEGPEAAPLALALLTPVGGTPAPPVHVVYDEGTQTSTYNGASSKIYMSQYPTMTYYDTDGTMDVKDDPPDASTD